MKWVFKMCVCVCVCARARTRVFAFKWVIKMSSFDSSIELGNRQNKKNGEHENGCRLTLRSSECFFFYKNQENFAEAHLFVVFKKRKKNEAQLFLPVLNFLRGSFFVSTCMKKNVINLPKT